MADQRRSRSPKGPRPRRGSDPGTPRKPRHRSEDRTGSGYTALHLTDDIVRELHATARPGKGGILVKVFGEAAAAFADGDYDTAIRLGDQAKHIALRAVSVRELLGLAYYRLGRWQEAARELSAFRRIGGTTEQNPVIADCYRALGKPGKAVELCDEVIAGAVPDPVFYEANIVAAGALADQDDLDAAVQRLERLSLDPEIAEEHHLRAWYLLGDLMERRGRFTQALEWFEAVLSADAELTDAAERVGNLRRKRDR